MSTQTKSNHASYTLRLVIMIIFTIYAMMQRLTPLAFICDSYIIPAVMLALSAAYLLWDLFTKRTFLKARYTVILIAFLVVTALSSLANIQHGFYTNVMIMIYLVVDFFIFYQFGTDRDIRDVNREFRIIGYCISIISLIYVLISISTYVLCMEYQYTSDTGRIIEQGYQSQYRRVWGFYYEANFQGLMAIIVLYFSVLNIKHSKSKFEKGFNIFNFIMHIVMLVLTGSRSSVVAFYVSVFVAAFYFAKLLADKYRLAKIKAVSVRVVSAGLVCVLAFGIVSLTKRVLPFVQQITIQHVKQEVRFDYADWITRIYAYNGKIVEFKNLDVTYNKDENGEAFEQQEITRLDIETKDDRSNGRVPVWRDSFKLFLMRPILGVSPSMSNRAAFAQAHFPDACDEIVMGVSLLNGYLEVLVGGGIVSVLVIGAFLLLCIRRLWNYQRENHTHRMELGLVTAILAGMLSFILFATDLFYSRTVYTYFFWICLGYGMYLIEYDETHDASSENFALACDTPFQTMNCVNFVLHNTDGSADNADLYIYHQFRNSHEIAERIRQSGIFHNVYDIEPYKTYSPLVQKFVTLYRMFLPQNTIQASCKQKLRLYRKGYKTLCISFPTPFTLGLHMAFPNAQVYHIEDGLGSYSGNLNADYASGLFRLIDRFFYSGKLELHPTACYLSAPAFSKSTMEGEVRQLPHLTPGSDLETMQQIFSYRANRLYRDRAVYLTQPLEERSTYRPEQEKRLFALVREKLSDRALVRIHPRQAEADFAGMEKDTYCNLWELECIDQIDDRNILISAFSTTQFMPKILKDAEPTVLFTYRLLLSDLDDPFLKDFANLIDDFRGLYRNPEKIYVPATFEELETILDTLSAQA